MKETAFNPRTQLPRTKAEALELLKYCANFPLATTGPSMERAYKLLSGNMAEFRREERYIVVKLSDIKSDTVLHKEAKRSKLMNLLETLRIPTRSAVVVEADWPEYEPVWKMIETRVMDAA